MIDVPTEQFYTMPMLDHSKYRGSPVNLDKIVTDTYGRTYVGQQTGDMLPNDSWHVYDLSGDNEIEEALFVPEEQEPFYDDGYQRYYYGERGFKAWLADTADYRYDFQHYRQAPGPDVALAMLIKDGHLPKGKYLLEVSW